MASSELLLSCLFARCHMHWMEESFTTKTEEQLYHTVGVVSLFTSKEETSSALDVT